MIDINKTDYRCNDKNYIKKKYDKKQILLGGSLRKGNNHYIRMSNKENGESKNWCTYSIDRDGNILQHFDPKYYSSFMKDNMIDKKSISIVLNNMGMLKYDGNSDKYINWIHEECDFSLVYEKRWNSGLYWEKYSEKQIDSLIELCDYLIEEFNIKRDCIGNNVKYSDTIKFNGIVCRSNYDMDYTDLNPSFNFEYFMKKLNINF